MLMNSKQRQWLTEAAGRIPGLFETLKQGSARADTTLGIRVINGKHVRLSLLAEVLNPGTNPLSSHASVNYPNTARPPERPSGGICEQVESIPDTKTSRSRARRQRSLLDTVSPKQTSILTADTS